MKYAELVALLTKILGEPHVGKNRHSWKVYLKKDSPPLRLMTVSDRPSIYDIPLGFTLPGAGELLNAFDIFWFCAIKKLFPHLGQDILSYGRDLDECLPPSLRGIPLLRKVGTLRRDLIMDPVEDIVRGNIVLQKYLDLWKTIGEIGGNVLRKEDFDGPIVPGVPLKEPCYTPTTKEAAGDRPLKRGDVIERYGLARERFVIGLYQHMKSVSAEAGFCLLDTKFEQGCLPGWTGDSARRYLGDERGTFYSSRYVRLDEYERWKQNRNTPFPPLYDKEPVRKWGTEVGIKKLDPGNPYDVAKAQGIIPPSELVDGWLGRWHTLVGAHLGMPLKEFQKSELRV